MTDQFYKNKHNKNAFSTYLNHVEGVSSISTPLCRGWITAIFVFLFFYTSSAQGWFKNFNLNEKDFATRTIETQDGGFLMVGHTGDGANLQDIFLQKLSQDGETQWQKTFGSNEYDEAIAIIPTQDGNFVLAGFTFNGGVNSGDVLLVKINYTGDILWWKTYGTQFFEQAKSVIELSDGNLAVVGRSVENSGDFDSNILLLKTDSEGEQIWMQNFGGDLLDDGFDLCETPDGGIVFVGASRSFSQWGDQNFFIQKVDNNGFYEWMKNYGGEMEEIPFRVQALNNGNIVVGGVTNSIGNGGYDLYLMNLNENGEEIWSKNYGGNKGEWGGYFTVLEDGFLITGSTFSYSPDSDVILVRTDEDGNELWYETHGTDDRLELGVWVEKARDEGFILTAQSRIDLPQIGIVSSNFFVLKTNEEGNVVTKTIRGKVYFDEDDSCHLNGNESGLSGWLVEAKTVNDRFFDLTDSDGNYEILIEVDTAILTIYPPNEYWNQCNNNIDLIIPMTFDSVEINFGNQIQIDCPDLKVDVATSFVKPCDSTSYFVHYKNRGNALAEDAKVEIQFDHQLNIYDASIGFMPLSNNNFEFNVGNLAVDESGSFEVFASLACDAEIGQTHCVEANIFPDSICTNPPPQWDGSSLEIRGECSMDSVIFHIKNIGTGDMNEEVQFLIIEDQIIGRAINVKLLINDSLRVAHYAKGKTIRMEGNQTDGHPGISRPNLTIEACGVDDFGNFSKGYFTQRPQNDNNPFISYDCKESVDSPNLNHKITFPKGIDNQHFIKTQTEIEYLIRFQNPGIDTVTGIVIRDTLSEYLDITTVRPGAGSHPFEMDVTNDGILTFTLTDIQLPDTSTNWDASHGFVKYRVAQMPNNPFDSLIINRAAIFYDFAAPVLTDTVFHTIQKPENFNIQGVSLCQGDVIDGVVYNNNAILFDTLFFVNYDSIIITNLDVLLHSLSEFNPSICEGENILVGNSTYSESGVYQDTLTSFIGCDSIITTTLTVNPVFEIVIDTLINSGDIYGGVSYFSDTTLFENQLSNEGCDSNLTIQILIISSIQSSEFAARIHSYPNPAHQHVFIEFELESTTELGIEIYNSVGQKIETVLESYEQQPQNYQFKIPIWDWQSGTYFIHFRTAWGSIVRKLMVKR